MNKDRNYFEPSHNSVGRDYYEEPDEETEEEWEERTDREADERDSYKEERGNE